jgi:hypothetical protein
MTAPVIARSVSDEAIQKRHRSLDCFASLAMTARLRVFTTQRSSSERRETVGPLLPSGTLPDDARKSFERDERLAGIGPVLQLLNAEVIQRLPAGAAQEQRARNVDHVGRARALVDQRRSAAAAEAAHPAGLPVLVAGDLIFSRGDPEALAPAADVGRVGGAVGEPAGASVIVPGPERRIVDLEPHGSAQAARGGARGIGKRSSFHRMRTPSAEQHQHIGVDSKHWAMRKAPSPPGAITWTTTGASPALN